MLQVWTCPHQLRKEILCNHKSTWICRLFLNYCYESILIFFPRWNKYSLNFHFYKNRIVRISGKWLYACDALLGKRRRLLWFHFIAKRLLATCLHASSLLPLAHWLLAPSLLPLTPCLPLLLGIFLSWLCGFGPFLPLHALCSFPTPPKQSQKWSGGPPSQRISKMNVFFLCESFLNFFRWGKPFHFFPLRPSKIWFSNKGNKELFLCFQKVVSGEVCTLFILEGFPVRESNPSPWSFFLWCLWKTMFFFINLASILECADKPFFVCVLFCFLQHQRASKWFPLFFLSSS